MTKGDLVMRGLLRILGLAIGVATSPLAAQQYHDGLYIAGGRGIAPASPYHKGIHLIDPAKTTTTTLFVTRSFSEGHQMDWDNRAIVFTTHAYPSTSLGAYPHAGLYRYHPSTNTIQTVAGPNTFTFSQPYRMLVNQDGDYVFTGQSATWRGSALQYGQALFKVNRSGQVNTLLTTTQIGRPGFWNGYVVTDIDTGKYLLCEMYYRSSPTTLRRLVYEVEDLGNTVRWGIWNDAVDSWYGRTSAPQNHRNGCLEAPQQYYFYQIRRGGADRVALKKLSTGNYMYAVSQFDLQTAKSPRLVGISYYTTGIYIFLLDRATLTPTATSFRKKLSCYDFDFYRGRHIQTVKTAPFRWDVRLSVPRFAGKSYVMVLGFTGVRPGLALPDGRNINLNYDVLTHMTLFNLIPPVFQAGPGVLDASGEAVGRLDVSAIGRMGLPIWIAAAVLDAQAPLGVAYLPDTRVMRL